MESSEIIRKKQIEKLSHLSIKVFLIGFFTLFAGIGIFIMGRIENDLSIQYASALMIVGGSVSIAAGFNLRTMVRRRSMASFENEQNQPNVGKH